MMRPKGIKKKEKTSIKRWTIDEALELYNIREWGLNFFDINKKGNIVVRPLLADGGEIDLKELVEDISLRGIQLPVLLRFTDILAKRLEQLIQCFQKAMEEYKYQGEYLGVYPMKVNQQCQVMEEIIRYGSKYSFGLEAGSKPELMIALAFSENPNSLIICNGYKDMEFIEMALLASKVGKKVIIVIEKLSELDLVIQVSKRYSIRPVLGIRVKLSSLGKGKWESSGGDKSKFGLFTSELLVAIEILKKNRMLDCFQLLHYHIGSQITAIQSIKTALTEGTRIFVEICKLGVPLKYFDVGGGLGVDYDGSKTNFASSTNYTMQEYAYDIVSAIHAACKEEKIKHPHIVTECGRAIVAHHSVLIFDILGASGLGNMNFTYKDKAEKEMSDSLKDLMEIDKNISRKSFQEAYHDAIQCKDEALLMFNLGYLSLPERAKIEELFWNICRKIARIVETLDYVPDELEGLESFLSDTYYGNFSLFQSAPDHWAVRQLFPIIPIHRLQQQPVKKATFADITCDSDGKFDQFIDLRDVKDTLEVHELKPAQPYYMGVFLLGAYQESLGDLHNLFGDPNTVHISIGEDGEYEIDQVIHGDSVRDVISYVDYQRDDLYNRLRKKVEKGVQKKMITIKESAQLLRIYDQRLRGYTYLENM